MVHVEFIIIHPFREGNGRTARILADLMAMQSNYPSLNYSSIEQDNDVRGFDNYIRSIHAGFNGDYSPIQEIFIKLISQAEKTTIS